MGNLLVYSGITTKIRAMRSRLLSEKDFEEISALHNVPEVVAYLKKHSAYADDFAQIDENKLHRGDVEKILVQSLYDDYSRLYRFSGIEVRKFMKLYLKRYEVDLINYCLRIIFNHYEQPFDLNYKRTFFDRYSQISIEKLITSRSSWTTCRELSIMNRSESSGIPMHPHCLIMIWHWICITTQRCGRRRKRS